MPCVHMDGQSRAGWCMQINRRVSKLSGVARIAIRRLRVKPSCCSALCALCYSVSSSWEQTAKTIHLGSKRRVHGVDDHGARDNRLPPGPKHIQFAARNGCWGVHETMHPDKGGKVCQPAGRRIR